MAAITDNHKMGYGLRIDNLKLMLGLKNNKNMVICCCGQGEMRTSVR